MLSINRYIMNFSNGKYPSLLLSQTLFFLDIRVLRYNLDTIQFILLRYTVQWFPVELDNYPH